MLIAAGSVVWGYDPHGDASFDGLVRVVLSQLLVILGFTALFTLISVTVRTYGGAIAAIILCSTVVNTIINGFSLIFGAGKTLNDYWVGGVVLKLATIAPFPDGFVRSLIVVAVWGIASLAAGIMLFKRMDIK
jgi:ABC-type transport system involved in multi-copper enzyme maturation permease subunit